MPNLDCISKRTLQTLAGERWFKRGEAYNEQGQVQDLTVQRDTISAVVVGSETYRVRLNCRDGRLTYACTCPLGDDGNFCKHCVAVGLAWLDQVDEVYTTTDESQSLQAFLLNMDHKQLVEFILGIASENRHLRDHLELKRSRSSVRS